MTLRCRVGWHHKDTLVRTAYYDSSTTIGLRRYIVTEYWKCRCGQEFTQEFVVTHESIYDNDPRSRDENKDWIHEWPRQEDGAR